MDAKYYQSHKEEIRAKQKAHYEQHKQEYSERSKRWRSENKEHTKEYKEKNKTRDRAKAKEWAKSNKEHLAEKMREYRKEKPDIIRAIEKRRKISPERRLNFNKYRLQWAKDNPEKVNLYYHNRRCRLSIENDLTASQIAEVRTEQNGYCYYCKNKLDNNGRGHIDHKKPISRGGRNTKSNIAIACCSCNMKKGAKTEEEYFEQIACH